MSSIIVVSGRSRGFIFHLDAGAAASVGRDESCDIQVVDDLVSRRHLELRADGDGGGFSVVDLESANGVYVDGAKVTESKLADGTVVQIGTTKLLFTERDFPDHDSALDFYKLRGQGEQQTFIAPPPGDDESGAV
jgi:pSer/pThr/pTyr-binding forkhead associated (FHA) protein